jgi:hypothetical protein
MISEMYQTVRNPQLGRMVDELFKETMEITTAKNQELEAAFLWKTEVEELEKKFQNNEGSEQDHQRYAELKEAFHNMQGRIRYCVATQNDVVSMLNKINALMECVANVKTDLLPKGE